MKHTPGPWYCGDFGVVTADRGDNRAMICRVMGARREADAKLIAAAPTLLEALKVCQVRLFLHEGSETPEYKMAAEAIKKAEV